MSTASFSRGGEDAQIPASIEKASEMVHLTSGRISIALALELMGIGPGHRVLVPAYNCTSMVTPVVHRGAEVTLYPLNQDLSIDLERLERLIEGDTRCLMAAHYFGFPQDGAALRAFCDAHGIFLLEDCAHAYFGDFSGRPPGSYGDYAIASSMKFFPVFDGGCLISYSHSLSALSLRSGSALFELKALLNTLERSFQYGRLRALKYALAVPLWLKDSAWRRAKKRVADDSALAPGSSEGGFDFDPAWLRVRMSRSSLALQERMPVRRIIARRRRHYARLLDALSGLAQARPLHGTLPDGVVPYVFPLLVDSETPSFAALKTRGVPLYRWEEIDANACPVSADYSRRLYQLPCHQDLRESELDWLIGQVTEVLGG